MRKLEYWVAVHKKSSSRNVRGRYKRDVMEEIKSGNLNPYHYWEPKKVSIEYSDNFDLMKKVISDLSWHEANLVKKNQNNDEKQ